MSRRQQLEKLIAARARGKTSVFARLIGRSDAVVYQLRSGHRLLGDALARHIEICCSLPQGWFDTDDAAPPVEGGAPDIPPISTALPVVLDAIAACPHRDELRTLLALLVDHDAPAYRQRLAELLGSFDPRGPNLTPKDMELAERVKKAARAAESFDVVGTLKQQVKT